MHSETKQIWEIPWIKDPFHEDNDTDDEEDYDSEYDEEDDETANSSMMDFIKSITSLNEST